MFITECIILFLLYSAIVYLIKRNLYPVDKEDTTKKLFNWRTGNEFSLFISPDYWWAFRFKSRIKDMFESKKEETLKLYVIKNNKWNLYFSLLVTLTCFSLFKTMPESYCSELIYAFALIRFISRSCEIFYAFVCDIFQQKKSSTGLTKHERIKLAALSYVEIFVFSSAVYVFMPQICSISQAIILTLSVGTLTNVGYAQNVFDLSLGMYIAFVQVITSQALVIFSLAGYLSRDNGV